MFCNCIWGGFGWEVTALTASEVFLSNCDRYDRRAPLRNHVSSTLWLQLLKQWSTLATRTNLESCSILNRSSMANPCPFCQSMPTWHRVSGSCYTTPTSRYSKHYEVAVTAMIQCFLRWQQVSKFHLIGCESIKICCERKVFMIWQNMPYHHHYQSFEET